MELVEARRGIVEPLVALTFDDGPSRWTEPIAAELERHGGRGTFFAIGEAVDTEEGRPLVLEGMTRRGLRSVTVSELLEAA